jgi:hypothetical protein
MASGMRALAAHLEEQQLFDRLHFARLAVMLVRSKWDYDPAVHGTTDDEIADRLLEQSDARKAARRAGGEG